MQNIQTSRLIEDLIQGILDGEPGDRHWASIDENARVKQAYYDNLDEVRLEIDRRIPKPHNT